MGKERDVPTVKDPDFIIPLEIPRAKFDISFRGSEKAFDL